MKKSVLTLVLALLLCVALGLSALAMGSGGEAAEGNSVNWLVTILVPLVISFIFCAVKKGQMKTAVKQRAADAYIPADGFKLTGKNDLFLYRTTKREKMASSSSNSNSK